ncbi:hypothetical protein KSB_35670 [Ktedonobacter robiniae]|uniref:Uncharacterized protein n=1 Tax=Ktedonobacter robiniae TaxID=2778365 RepID=A0ABQ3URU8_9CHLR|nr:hypothetical protein KSB_35670 [Ktedonobacter robiniae]
MSRESKKEKAERLYAFLLMFYPQGYRYAFGSQMLQTFRDHYTDVVESGQQAEGRFWFGVVSDEARGILREQCAVLKESTNMKTPGLGKASSLGLCLV